MTVQGHEIAWLDVFALALLLFFFVRGCVQGFLWQMAGLATVGGGLYVASRFAAPVAAWLHELLPSFKAGDGWDVIISFGALFIGVTLFVFCVVRLLKRLVDGMQLSGVDRFLGGLLGLAKATLLLCALVAGLSLINVPVVRDSIAHAWTRKAAEYAIEKGGPFFPEELRTRVVSVGDEIRGRMDDAEVAPAPPGPGAKAAVPQQEPPVTSTPPKDAAAGDHR